MLCEEQKDCKNCQNEFKCYGRCTRYLYSKNNGAIDNFSIGVGRLDDDELESDEFIYYHLR